MKNHRENDREWIAGLELDSVPEIVDEKLQALYRELPENVPVGKKRGMKKAVKRLLTAASAVAAAFLILLFGAAVNPALAENIPFIGNLFTNIASREGWKNSKQTLLSLEKYAQPLEDATMEVPAAGEDETPLTLSAEEYYYDGTFLHIGLSAQINSTAQHLYFRTFSGGYNILINGEELGHFEKGKGVVYEETSFELDRCYLAKIDSGRYIGKRGQVLPERFRNQKELSVTLRFSGLYGLGAAHAVTRNSSPIELNFTVRKSDVPVLTFDGGGVEMGGVVLGSGVATPGGMLLTIDRPDSYRRPICGVTFEGGGVIGSVGYVDHIPNVGNGLVHRTLISGGYAEDEKRRLLVSVFDENGTGDYVAVFLIDPRTGKVEFGNADDIVHLTSRIYYCPAKEMVLSKDQHKIETASYKNGGNELLLYIATKDRLPQEDMIVEVWQGGVFMGSRVSEGTANMDYFARSFSYDEETGQKFHYETIRCRYTFSVLGMEDLDSDFPMTVKIYGADGDLQMEEIVRLRDPETYERAEEKSKNPFA